METSLDEHPLISKLWDEARNTGIEVDRSHRRLQEYSYDASNYRVVPGAVAFPRSLEETRQLLQLCQVQGIEVTFRGGGTSMAGNAIGSGLVIDFSRYLTSISSINETTQSVWVDAGVILSELREQVEKETLGRLTFAPDPSSQSRATVGGSIGNDACGNHSVAYGRISHHVLELEILTIDGAHLIAGPGGVAATEQTDNHSVVRAEEINRRLQQITEAHLAPFRTELGLIPRQVSGFQLDNLLPEKQFNVARALAGTEGTCAVVLKAHMKLVPKPQSLALLCLGYDNTVDSARDVMEMISHSPSAIEGLDSSIVDIMRERRGQESVRALPQGKAFVLVEFAADTLSDASHKCENLVKKLELQKRVVDHAIVTESKERAGLWKVREDGAGLSSKRLDGSQTWPGWEDSAVSPEHLADYLEELIPLITAHGYTTAMYGHFGAGCIHMRLDADLRSKEGRQAFREYLAEAAELVVKHGGSLSGEHGDGRARSELLSTMYSPNLINAFAEFKEVWDPQYLLNPGIIVRPDPVISSMAIAGMPQQEHRPTIGLPLYAGDSHSCIGVGRCRASTGAFMCPSYRATKDEKDSTRARSRVLQELVRNNDSSVGGWKSPEVREALDLCLSCKACSSDCPTGVDIAEAKSELINDHYRGRIRPFTHYSIGWLPRWLPAIKYFSSIANWGSSNGLLRNVANKLGISAQRKLPQFKNTRIIMAAKSQANFVEDADVLLFADSFTQAFRPDVITSAARVMQSAGHEVGCTPDACCGLTWISTGQRDAARKKLTKLVDRFDDGTERPIVVLEPSCAATIRDEGPKLVGTDAAHRVARRIKSFSMAVQDEMKAGWQPSVPPPHEVVLQTHCHEHAVFGSTAQRNVLATWGVSEVHESSSCCGVAGNFGFESDHFEMSMKVAEHSIVPALESANEGAIVFADGFSCSMQVAQLNSNVSISHLAQALDPSGHQAEKLDKI